MKKAITVFLLLAVVWMLTTVLAGAARLIAPPAGQIRLLVGIDDVLDLAVNTTPRAGDTAAAGWLAVSFSPFDQIYLLTGRGAVLYQPQIDLDSATYPYASTGGHEIFVRTALSAAGLRVGDSVLYAYVYRPAGQQALVMDNVVRLDIAGHSSGLQPVASEDALAQYLQKALTCRPIYPPIPYMVDGENSPPPAFSGTNLQESDVDEADIIKSDGTYLYTAPAPSGQDIGKTVQNLTIYRLDPQKPSADTVAQIDLDTHAAAVSGLYLAGDTDDRLITIGGSADFSWYYWDAPYYWQQQLTEVVVYDVSTPAVPRQLHRLTLDGVLVSSRRIGSTLYLVTRYIPYLSEDDATDLPPLPQVCRNKVDCRALIDVANSYAPLQHPDYPLSPSLITVSAMDIDDPENMVSTSVVGAVETVYVSARRLFLATTFYDATHAIWRGQLDATTDIHQFDLTEDGPVYQASGAVPGHLGWETDKRSFRLSDYKDHLRVTTSMGDTWSGDSATRLTVLKSLPDADPPLLGEVSRIVDIGETGERLYAARYMGDMAALVTFRVTDPLYLIDLHDPAKPFIAGELHIEGYSDYLHPIGDNWLLGIGKDAVPDESATDFNGRGAWYQGLKLALFDISDAGRPIATDTLVIGKRGTESAALHDHHALAWLAPAENRPARLAIPIELHNEPSDKAPEPWSHYDWTHTGLYAFNLHTTGGPGTGMIEPLEPIVVEKPTTAQSYPMWNGYGDRAVIVNNAVYYLHNDRIWPSPVW